MLLIQELATHILRGLEAVFASNRLIPTEYSSLEWRVGVLQAHEVAMQNGGTSEGQPGLRPEYHAHYYGAYFRDPDGNKLCVACHEPE
jgi:catechol 2,3-dioxygenase-like lactoylglutathione lyase family enzyme